MPRTSIMSSGGAGPGTERQSITRQVILTGLRSRHFYRLYILGLLLLYCSLFYYFGELVDFFKWDNLRWEFFYSVHDIHRLLFLAPIVYAGYIARVKGAVLITLVTLLIFLPRGFLISPFPDPILRMVLFITIAGVLGSLTGIARGKLERSRWLEAMLRGERDALLGIMNSMADGVLVTGPDYRIRFMNSSMVKDFGDGVGSACHKCLHDLDSPCAGVCKLENVIAGKVEWLESRFPGGNVYQVVASPFIDSDGVTCQLCVFRNVARARSSKD